MEVDDMSKNNKKFIEEEMQVMENDLDKSECRL